MLIFGRKNRALLGLDISSTAIKLLELSHASGATAELYRVESFAVEPLPLNAVVERKIADVEAVGQAIQKALLRSGTTAKRAAVAVSGSSVITKIISMSAALSEAEMENQIQLEADQYIPYPLEEVNIDFDIIGPSENGNDMVDVLLAASRRENVDDRVAALEIAGLKTEIVDVEAYAMENAYALILDDAAESRRDHTVAIADVGSATTTLHVLHNGSTVYTREQNFGSHQLLDEIQRRYGLSRDQALLRLDAGDLPETYRFDVLGPYTEALVQQIARALQFFYSASTFNRADQIVLAGGSARIARLQDLVEDRLGFPAAVADPFSRMAIAPGVDEKALLRTAPAMMIAVGLALREFI